MVSQATLQAVAKNIYIFQLHLSSSFTSMKTWLGNTGMSRQAAKIQWARLLNTWTKCDKHNTSNNNNNNNSSSSFLWWQISCDTTINAFGNLVSILIAQESLRAKEQTEFEATPHENIWLSNDTKHYAADWTCMICALWTRPSLKLSR